MVTKTELKQEFTNIIEEIHLITNCWMNNLTLDDMNDAWQKYFDRDLPIFDEEYEIVDYIYDLSSHLRILQSVIEHNEGFRPAHEHEERATRFGGDE